MYKLTTELLSSNLIFYRKKNNLTLKNLGDKIHKSKATISKYETGDIVPDIITILEICNTLNISLSQLIPTQNKKNSIQHKSNFEKLYLYYYSNNIIFQSILEFTNETNHTMVKLYNGIKNITNYKNVHSYYYEGLFETNFNIGYINLKNIFNENIPLEKVQITFTIPWTSTSSIYTCFITGLTPNLLPVIKKGILSTKPLNCIENFKNHLIIDKQEIEKIEKNNSWILENENYDQFFYN